MIISPSKWGNIYLSKHHYSIELAQLGNEVYYLEPVISSNNKEIKIWQPLTDLPNLKIITAHMPKLYEMLRFKLRSVYDILMPFFIQGLLKKITKNLDIAWCFETNLYSNLKNFEALLTIYHPVDLAAYRFQRKIAASADITISISESIAEGFKHYSKKVLFVNHGLSKPFTEVAEQTLQYLKKGENKKYSARRISVGFVGNLCRSDLNRDFIIAVIKEHPNITFHIWGPKRISNVDGELTERTIEFISFLKTNSNVFLHGVKSGTELALEIKNCDILLLALNNSKMYDGSNSHKIIEYLSTGKAIVSHFVNTYANEELLVMASDDSSKQLMIEFNKVVHDLEKYNSKERQIKRIEFALNNTYSKHIQEIESYVNSYYGRYSA